MVVGEHQKYASALVLPDFKYLKEWCESRQLLSGQTHDGLICLPEVWDVYKEEIARLNKTLSEPEQILRFRLVPDEWSPATGELSASLKLKREVIEAKYSDLLEAIYHDGRKSTV